MKTDINIHMFPARHMVRAVRLAVLSLLLWLGLMPASAQIYSTAQRGTQYKGTYEEAYGSMNDGYYGSMEAQYEYNPYQSNVYKPGSSTPNTSLRKRYTIPSYSPWSDSYAPMRTNKKNAPTGSTDGAIGEDNESENDPEGETGAPDGFITPSDPGHQSNQSPVGEAWILLFFAAAAALVVFIRQKREKRHIAIYFETQQPSDKSNMKQHIRKSLFISIILLAGVSNAWAATQRYIYVGISKNYYDYKDNNNYGFNFWGGTSGGVKSGTYLTTHTHDGRTYYMYRVQVYDDNNKAQFKGNNNWWDPGDGYSVTLNGTTNNAVFFSHTNDGWQGQFQENYQETSTAKLTASNTSVTTGTNVTLTPSLSSNDTYNQIKSTTYTVSTNPNSGGSVTSAGVFSATKAGTYTVTATVTYNPKYFTGITKTATATQTINVYDTQYVLRGSINTTDDPEGGMAGWGATNNNAYSSATIDGNTMTIVANLTNAKTQYKFKIYNNFDGSYYGQQNDAEIPDNTLWTLNGSNDVKFTTTAAGSYTFVYNTSNNSIKVQYPTAYTVTYSRVPTASANAPTTDPSISSGDYVLANTPVTFTAKTANTGYTWKGWYSNNSGTGDALSTNLAYTRSITANTTIYAVYTANTYTVKFDANGGSGTMSDQNFTYGTSQNLTANNFTRTGYTFAGWATSANGNKVYDDIQSVSNLSTTNGATVTLYAKWTETKHSITVNANPQSYGKVSTNSVSVGQFTSSANITATANEGYKFVNWTATEGITINNPNNKTTTIKATKAGTLTANFQALPGKTVYLQPVDYWLDDNARFAVYAWNGSSDEWIKMEDVGCNREYFSAEIPAQYQDFNFVRINPAATELSFDVAWNQTPNLTVPTDIKNLFTYPRIYLKPNSNWTTDNARFAARFYQSSGSNEVWVNMTDEDGDGYYSCEKPNGYDMVIFCRMNPSTNENNWDNKWNQTVDLSIQETHIVSANCFTLYDDSWNNGSWSTLWTTYSAPKYSVTLNATNNGTTTATYNSTTKTSKNNGTATLTNIPLNQNVTFTFEPAEGYQFANAKITIGNQELEVYTSTFTYPICGPATVSAHFVATETRKIYLRPNDVWMKDSPVFATYAFKEGSDVHQWYIMNTEDTDYTGAYSCDISTTYDHVHFVRINPRGSNPHNQGINWANAWNQTIDLEIVNQIYDTENKKRFVIEGQTTKDGKNPNHYDGEWEENTPIWGITSDSDNWHAEKAIFMGYPGKANILLSAASHEFKLYNFRHDHYYGNTGTYQRTNNGQWWTMDNEVNNNCTMVADIDNEAYLFQLQLITELGTYKKQISITYPDYSAGAYRLAYRDNTPNSFHPAHYIRCNTTKDQLDTVSFFIHHDKEPEILLQRCSIADVYAQNPTWETIAIYPATSSFPSGDHPNNAQLPGKKQSDATIHIGEGCGITSSGVYNFILQQTNTGEHTAELDTRATHPYEGDYYIRTDYAEGGWTNYLEPANLMTYSSYADNNEPFSYYFCEWITSPRTKDGSDYSNIAYTIANPYSRCISDTLIGDDIIEKNGVTEGCLPDSANVRFTWDHETNALARAYIRGSGHSSDRFLVLTGKDENLKDADGEVIPEGNGDLAGILANEKLLTDMGNWIYQVDVTANRATLIKLTAKYNDFVQYFKGSKGDNDDNYASLLSSTADDSYKIRIIYDFKTNHLITAWLPDELEDIPDDEELGADMMIIRTNQGATQQINFTNNATLSDVGIGYAVMTFTKDHVNGSSSQYNRALYWVSFPFDVWLQDVFGFGEYGQHWIMEYYDGASRAANGLWADSDTYWKYITNPNYKLEAGKGYVLCLNLGKMTASSAVFAHTDEVSLYFPSASPLQTITSEVTAAEVPAHTCTIERDNRNIYDSNWNLIGVPGFKDIHIDGIGGSAHEQYNDEIDADCVSFYYAYQPDDNTYTAGDASRTNNFQIMYSYMVQFVGEILWSSKTFSTTPASVAARRTGDMPSEHTLRLELAQGEDKADQTIIKLQEQDATADFDMNIDMTKIKNSGANIYTLTENTAIMVAGNALPMEKTTIPVGIEVANAGTYTLRMPDGTDGISVTLFDNQTGIHTDMLLSEYTITLDAGSHLNRFYIAVDPDRTATSVENVGEEAKGDKAKGVEKYLIDGQLFIRTAEGIFDARGQRM